MEALNQVQQRQRSVEVSSKAQAAYVGEGLLPVPPKLVEMIERGDFVDVRVNSRVLDGPQRCNTKGSPEQGQETVPEHLCVVAVYVAVIAGKHPERVSELMAYMILIIKASQEYKVLAWFMYDEAFRRQAAATGLTEWSKINPSIFTVCFNTRARSGTRCELCLTLGHDAEGCTRSEGEGDLALR